MGEDKTNLDGMLKDKFAKKGFTEQMLKDKAKELDAKNKRGEEDILDYTPSDTQRKRGWGILSKPSKYRTYDF